MNMFRDGKKCMEDNHPADKHICLLFTWKVNDVCWQAEWSTDDGLKAPMPDVCSTFGLVLFPCSVIHISLPNIVCKAGLRATVAGHMLPWPSAPALLLPPAESSLPLATHQPLAMHQPLAACFKLELWLSQPTVLGRPQNLQVKNRFCTCSPNPTYEEHHGGDVDATRLLNVMLAPPWHWDLQPWTECIHCLYDMGTLMGISVRLMKGNITRRQPWSKGKPERQNLCAFSFTLSNF